MTDEQKKIIQDIGLRCLGIKYQFGTKADLSVEPEQIQAIDCSGLVKYVFHKAGIEAPDGSQNQFDASEPIDIPETGCFAFKSQNGKIMHVALVLEANAQSSPISKPLILILEASGSLGQVALRDLDSFKIFPHNIDFAGFRKLKSL